MNNLSKKNSNKKKGKKILTLFDIQTWVFIFSGILLILAASSGYSVYIEGKTAQKNAQKQLEKFERVVLKTETSEPRNTDAGTDPAEVQQISSKSIDKPKVEYTPIAKLQAEKIGLNVSVLSEWSYELLDISVNKFSGPQPNEPGNFVVIGHNYLNGAHFGSLDLLEIGDLIDLTDLSGKKVTYEVYEILTIRPDDAKKLMTDRARTLTLVTCAADNQWRLVIKSKESSL